MKFSQPLADVYVPDQRDAVAQLASVTHLCLAAHQDDIEIMAYAGIVDCYENPARHFGGVVVTNGAGSPRTGDFAHLTDAQMQLVRRDEQRKAAELGKYAVQIQLAHPSASVKQAGQADVVGDLETILRGCQPEVLYVHNPADKHDTHIAVLARCLEAVRRLPRAQRPRKVIGCEVWRDLDWLVDADKVAMDSGRRPELALPLLTVFASQVVGGKRYDLATLGRRSANATFHTSHQTDRTQGITWGIDLTPVFLDDERSLAEHCLAHIDRFRHDVRERLQRYC